LYQLDLCDVYHSKWLNCVKDILNKCGFINCWNDQFVPRNFNLSKKVKRYFCDSYVENWKLQIFNAPKCTNYRLHKSEFGLEKYFTILSPDLMYNMCKFRCGSHKLTIEMGRFFSIYRSERICDLCNKEELGDEFQYPNTISFSELMNSDDKYVLIGLSKYAKIVMSVFK
jgi:hypothetical protein